MKLRKKILGVITTLTIMVSLVASASAAAPPYKTILSTDEGVNGYVNTQLITYKYTSSSKRTATSIAICQKSGSRYMYTSASLLNQTESTLSLKGAVNPTATMGNTVSASTTETSYDAKISYSYSYIKSFYSSSDKLDYTIISQPF